MSSLGDPAAAQTATRAASPRAARKRQRRSGPLFHELAPATRASSVAHFLDLDSTPAPWYRRPAIVWFRARELRIHDHPALHAASRRNVPLLLVFVLDHCDDDPVPARPVKESSPANTVPTIPSLSSAPPSPPQAANNSFRPFVDNLVIDVGRLTGVPTSYTTDAHAGAQPSALDPLVRIWTLTAASPPATPPRSDTSSDSRRKRPRSRSRDGTEEGGSSTLASVWNLPKLNTDTSDVDASDMERMDVDVSEPVVATRSNAQRRGLYYGLKTLSEEIRGLGGSLILLKTSGRGFEEVVKLAAEMDADAVYWNRQQTDDDRAQEDDLKIALRAMEVTVHDFRPDMLLDTVDRPPPRTMRSFEAFCRYWLAALAGPEPPDDPVPSPQSPIRCFASMVERSKKRSLEQLGLVPQSKHQDLDPPPRFDERPANMLASAQYEYEMSLGRLSKRSAWKQISLLPHGALLQSLALGDYAIQFAQLKMRLGEDPSETAVRTCPPPFRGRSGDDVFRWWRQGTTGFPLVDAAMRLLRKTGFLSPWLRAFLVHFACHVVHIGSHAAIREIERLSVSTPHGQTQLIRQCLTQGLFGLQVEGRGDPNVRLLKHARGFVRMILPELDRLPDPFVLCPWAATSSVRQVARLHLLRQEDTQEFNLEIERCEPWIRNSGRGYPQPFVSVSVARRRSRDFSLRMLRVAVSFKIPQPTLRDLSKRPRTRGNSLDVIRHNRLLPGQVHEAGPRKSGDETSSSLSVISSEAPREVVKSRPSTAPSVVLSRNVREEVLNSLVHREVPPSGSDVQKLRSWRLIAVHVAKRYELTDDPSRLTSKHFVRLCKIRDEMRGCGGDARQITVNNMKEFFRYQLRLDVTGEWDRHYHGGIRGPYVYGIRRRS